LGGDSETNRTQAISPSPSALARNALKGLGGSAHKKSAIVKADRHPAIVTALDYFPYFTLQRHFGFPGESFSDQFDSVANFETDIGLRFALLHFPFGFSHTFSATRLARYSGSVAYRSAFSLPGKCLTGMPFRFTVHHV
jgi:hypothetical protein